MQFGLNESQRILQSNARKFFAAECPIAKVLKIAETETAHDRALWRKMAEQGFLGVVFSGRSWWNGARHGGTNRAC